MAQKITAVTKTGPNAIALPDFIPGGDTRGAENISREDLRIPRLSLAQALSPQLKKSDPKYIEGLKAGDVFNSITGFNYGTDPIEVVIVRADKAKWIEFDPEKRGVILDRNVSPGDPRTAWGSGVDGKPAATKFLEFVAYILPGREPIALSFSRAGLECGTLLSTLIQLKRGELGGIATFALRFSLTPTEKTHAKSGGTFAVFAPKFLGLVEDKETFDFGASFYDSIKDRALETDREDDGAGVTKDDVPF
jgi:hypothetical protein